MLDHIDVISTQFVAGVWVAAALLLALAILAILRPHRRRALRACSLGVVAFLALTVATADSVNAHYAYLPTVGDIRAAVGGDRQWVDARNLAHLSARHQRQAEAKGVIIRMAMPSDPSAGFAHSIAIAYLPKQYFTEPTRRFPVVYLLHGSPGRPSDWFHAGEAGSVAQRVADGGNPAILVAAQLSRSWLDDSECVNGVKLKVESHLFGVVIPTIDKTFRTQADRMSRTLAGMSAGGYCALNLGLRHRSAVATIIDMSGYDEPTYTGGLSHLFGRLDDSASRIAENTPRDYAPYLPRDPATRVWLDAGSSDKTVMREMSHLAPVLTSRGIDVQWRVRKGGHTYWVWTAALQESLPWALCGHPGRPAHDRSHSGPM